MADRALPFELATLSSSAEAEALLNGRRGDLDVLYGSGVPKGFVTSRYLADSHLSVALDAVGHKLVKFGTTVLGGSMCLDPVTGEVVQVLGTNSSRWFVNSTLEAFVATVRDVSTAFPFYSDDAPEAEIEAAAKRVVEIIRRVDAEALVPDRYWSTFVDDMRIGDWSTGAVLDLIGSGY